jgi:PKD repeat protein
MNPSGAALAVYSTTDSSALQFATKAPGASSFSAPVALAEAPSQGPAVAIDDAGDGVAVFASGHTGSAVAQARGFDATPPSIDGASIPGAAQTGTSVAFTAQASDMWGPVTLSWDFGDGTPIATGASVTHTFAAAGTHTVTVTATDAVGNASSKTGSIAVATALVRPTISKASIKPKRFQAGHKAVFTFTLNEEAGVTITIARQQRAKHHRRRFKRTGALSGPGLVGVNHIRFTGKVGRRTLKPGRYRATLIATAGHAKSPPISLSFTILRAG